MAFDMHKHNEGWFGRRDNRLYQLLIFISTL